MKKILLLLLLLFLPIFLVKGSETTQIYNLNSETYQNTYLINSELDNQTNSQIYPETLLYLNGRWGTSGSGILNETYQNRQTCFKIVPYPNQWNIYYLFNDSENYNTLNLQYWTYFENDTTGKYQYEFNVEWGTNYKYTILWDLYNYNYQIRIGFLDTGSFKNQLLNTTINNYNLIGQWLWINYTIQFVPNQNWYATLYIYNTSFDLVAYCTYSYTYTISSGYYIKRIRCLESWASFYWYLDSINIVDYYGYQKDYNKYPEPKEYYYINSYKTINFENVSNNIQNVQFNYSTNTQIQNLSLYNYETEKYYNISQNKTLYNYYIKNKIMYLWVYENKTNSGSYTLILNIYIIVNYYNYLLEINSFQSEYLELMNSVSLTILLLILLCINIFLLKFQNTLIFLFYYIFYLIIILASFNYNILFTPYLQILLLSTISLLNILKIVNIYWEEKKKIED